MQIETELLAWLRLLRMPQWGAARIRASVRDSGSATAALEAEMSSRCGHAMRFGGGGRHGDRLQESAFDRDRRWLDRTGCSLLRFTDDEWPELLESIPDPPAALFVRGNAGCLWQPQIAIVGSRHATCGGIEHAREFATAFARAGLTVTSGFARGIDTASHAAALAAGGFTVAVCGTGLDIDYPRGSAPLADAIAEGGALVSEHGCGDAPNAAHFPRRNRLIAGLSLGTLVVEAGLKSGSLITARLAAEQGREVFAIPGSIRNPLARGCHALIRDGARLVESVDEVCEALKPMAAELASAIRGRLGEACEIDTRTAPPEFDPIGKVAFHDPIPGVPRSDSLRTAANGTSDALLAAVGFDPIALETLLGSVKLETSEVSARLLTLELAGFIEALPGARYVRLR